MKTLLALLSLLTVTATAAPGVNPLACADTMRRATGAVGWWNAGDVLFNGAGVAAMWDKTALGHNLTNPVAGAQPTWTNSGTGLLNGYPTIYFDGVGQYLKTAAFTWNQPESINFVGKQITWVDGVRIIDGASAASALLETGVSPQIYLVAGGGGFPRNTTMTVGSWKSVNPVFNGATSYISVNGVVGTIADPGANNLSGITLGASFQNLLFSNIQVAEILGFSTTNSYRDDYLTRLNDRKYNLGF